jgi:2-dehydropantoate 2-reductase
MSTSFENHAAPRIAVIGPGALGTLFAARLGLAGLPVLLFDYRPERAALLSEIGVQLLTPEREHTLALPVTADPIALAEVDAAIILVKAYRTEAVAVLLAEYLNPAAIALTLQNGLGNVETLALHLGAERVFGGTTAQGAILEEPGVVRDTGSGPTVLDSAPRLDAVAAALLQAGYAISRTDDPTAALWTKAILNAAINPVAALTLLRNGQLVEHEPSLKLMAAAAREAWLIARAHGVDVADQDWRARLIALCTATASNINSMQQDILRARPTEVDAINGAIVRTAELHDLPVSVNRTLWYLVKTVEEGYQAPGPDED